jgi:hypothetical protein
MDPTASSSMTCSRLTPSASTWCSRVSTNRRSVASPATRKRKAASTCPYSLHSVTGTRPSSPSVYSSSRLLLATTRAFSLSLRNLPTQLPVTRVLFCAVTA